MKKFRKICVMTSALIMALNLNIPAVSAVELQISSVSAEKTAVDYQQQALTLMGALDYIDKIGGGNISLDTSASFTDSNGNEFAPVVKTQFSTTSDLRSFMESSLTKKFINYRYSGILDTDDPSYIDYKGKLYGKVTAKGCGFEWTSKTPEIKNITDTSFDIIAEYDNYGTTDYMTLNVVLENGLWKINKLSEGSASNKIAGDANNDGKVDVADVVAVASYVSNPEKNKLTEQGIINGDVHNSGNGLNANDALAVQQYLANIITKF